MVSTEKQKKTYKTKTKRSCGHGEYKPGFSIGYLSERPYFSHLSLYWLQRGHLGLGFKDVQYCIFHKSPEAVNLAVLHCPVNFC